MENTIGFLSREPKLIYGWPTEIAHVQKLLHMYTSQ